MNMTRRTFLMACGVAGGGGLLAACGVLNQEPDYTVVLDRGNTFVPGVLTVPIGSTIAWHNQADQVHTVTADPARARRPERVVLPPGVAAFDSGDLFTGERWVYTVETPGLYVYYCRYYELEEMIGSIRVTA